MKMSQLKMAIREVVREEIHLGLKELLGEVKKQPTQQVQKPQSKKKQQYSKNPVLNEVLNETDASDWETMGGAEYTSDRMGEIVGNSYKDLMNNNQSQNGGVVVDGQRPDFLKKDYRKLMDAVDKKQGK
jgi:hypothetical protein